MRPVVTPAQMGAADRRTIAAGTPEAVLVERAGAAVARAARRMLGGAYGRRVVVARGRGNNGADGAVAAGRLRAAGIGVDEFVLADGIDEAAFRRSVARAHLAIDGMFGTGFHGALEGDAARVARILVEAAIPTLAIDIPSGVDGATGEVHGAAVCATETVCFAALKPGLLFEPGRTHAGRVRVVDIGIEIGYRAITVGTDRMGYTLTPGPKGPPVEFDEPLHVLDASDLRLPRRAAEGHKWSAGAFVIGGSTGMVGAPLMAAHAAARSGAGMVVCGVPGAEAAARASGSELVTRALAATATGGLDAVAADAVLAEIERFQALAIGPGLGREAATQTAVRTLVAQCPIPIVVDADGLNAIAADPEPLRARVAAGRPLAILTPHAGEYARLAGEKLGADRVQAARDLAARLGAIVLLKGPGTVIAAPDGRAVVNRTGGPELSTAGTGDVLTGIITGLLAAGGTPFHAAAAGAYVHGRAATQAGTGDDLVAGDLIGALHPTLAALRSGRDPWEE